MLLLATAHATNILVVIADDLGADKVGSFASYGSTTPAYLPETPTLDALSSAGLSFTSTWAGPMCSITRAALHTGMFPHRTGVGWAIDDGSTEGELDNAGWTTLAERFAADGFATGQFGKWHVGTSGSAGRTEWDLVRGDPDPLVVSEEPHPLGAGFHVYVGDPDAVLPDYDDWTSVTATGDGTATLASETENADDVATTEALDWIGAQTGEWFAVVAYNSPQRPYDGDGWDTDDVDPACYVDACLEDRSCGDYDGDGSAAGDEARLIYSSMVACMDGRIDALLAGIPVATLRDTIVVFVGDNGTESALLEGPYADRSRGKGTLYETGVRVPLIVLDGQHWVDLEAGRGFSAGSIRAPGRVVTSQVATMDLHDTLLEAAGVAVPAGTDAISLWTCAATTSATCATPRVARSVYTEGYAYDGAALERGAAALRSGRNKLVVTYTGSCLDAELYDLVADPYEATDLAAANPTVVGRMRSTLSSMAVSWMTGLPWCS